MSSKHLIWGGMTIGSMLGGALPFLWGGDLLSSTIWTAVGGFGGIWVGYKFAKASGAL